MPLLPAIETPAHYYEVYKQELWLPAIQHLARLHQLEGKPVRATQGSNIIYRIGQAWLKLIVPFSYKDVVYEIAGLECLSQRKDILTPQVLFKGELEGWPYVILSHVEGVRIADVFSNLSSNEQIRLAQKMAQVTKAIHSVKPSSTILGRGNWNEFIEGRFASFYTHHKNKKLTGAWLDNMPAFMAQFSVDNFKTTKPRFLHSDLTGDHYLVTQVNGNYEITGIIDLADCRVAHPEYDMAASVIFVLKKNREAMRSYVNEMGIADLNSSFSEKLMAWTILHYYSNLNTYFSEEMVADPTGDFSALAKLVFPLD